MRGLWLFNIKQPLVHLLSGEWQFFKAVQLFLGDVRLYRVFTFPLWRTALTPNGWFEATALVGGWSDTSIWEQASVASSVDYQFSRLPQTTLWWNPYSGRFLSRQHHHLKQLSITSIDHAHNAVSLSSWSLSARAVESIMQANFVAEFQTFRKPAVSWCCFSSGESLQSCGTFLSCQFLLNLRLKSSSIAAAAASHNILSEFGLDRSGYDVIAVSQVHINSFLHF